MFDVLRVQQQLFSFYLGFYIQTLFGRLKVLVFITTYQLVYSGRRWQAKLHWNTTIDFPHGLRSLAQIKGRTCGKGFKGNFQLVQ